MRKFYFYFLLYIPIPIMGNDSTLIAKAKIVQAKYYTKIQNKKYVTLIDFTKSIDRERLFVVDLFDKKIILKSKVSHGIMSGLEYATNFSNINDSKKSSLGAYLSNESYYGMWGYSMKLDGLDKGINDMAKKRVIVFHSSKKMRTKWSWGCFATPEEINTKLINIIKNGSLIYVFN